MSKKKENVFDDLSEKLIEDKTEKKFCECENLEVTEDIKNITKRRVINVY